MFDFSIDGNECLFVMDNKQIISINELNTINICLLCLETSENYLEIFGKKGIELNVAVVLRKHFWFEVKSVFIYGYPEKV